MLENKMQLSSQLVNSLPTQEEDRIKLAIELGNKSQVNESALMLYKEFGSLEALLLHLFENYPNKFFTKRFSCFYPFPCTCGGKFGFRPTKGPLGAGNVFNIENYEGRLPMSALIKAKEAKERGIKELYIVDPDMASKTSDPALYGKVGDRRFLIWIWEDKQGK